MRVDDVIRYIDYLNECGEVIAYLIDGERKIIDCYEELDLFYRIGDKFRRSPNSNLSTAGLKIIEIHKQIIKLNRDLALFPFGSRKVKKRVRTIEKAMEALYKALARLDQQIKNKEVEVL